jgi:hypothetical protein
MEKSAFEKWLIRNYPIHEEMYIEILHGLYNRNGMYFDLMEKYAPGEQFDNGAILKVISKLTSNDTDNPILPDIDEFTPDESDLEEAERQVRVNKLLSEE